MQPPRRARFRELVSSVQDAGHLADVDPEELVHALQWREELCSQAPGRGIFCPEGWNSGVDRVVGTIALSRRALDLGVTDGRHVDVIFLLLGPRIIHGRRYNPAISTSGSGGKPSSQSSLTTTCLIACASVGRGKRSSTWSWRPTRKRRTR